MDRETGEDHPIIEIIDTDRVSATGIDARSLTQGAVSDLSNIISICAPLGGYVYSPKNPQRS